MVRIDFPLNPGTTGQKVADLQDGLTVLLRRSIFVTGDAPNSPTVEELATLATTLQREREESRYGDATRQLALLWQVQTGLGDNRGGAVDQPTADSLNAALEKYNAFDGEVARPSLVRRSAFNPPWNASSRLSPSRRGSPRIPRFTPRSASRTGRP